MTQAIDNTENSQSAYDRVGRLASFGLEHPWQAALFLPSSYLDCRHVNMPVEALEKKNKGLIRLKITSTPSYQGRGGPPRLGFNVSDATGMSYQASIFGDTKVWLEAIKPGGTYLFLATGHEYGGRFRVTVHELLPDKYCGRIIPQYPAPKAQIEPEVLRALIAKFLPNAIPTAATHISSQLEEIAPLQTIIDALNAPDWTIESLLQHVHYPQDMDYIPAIRLTLERLAALGSLAKANAEKTEFTSNPIRLETLDLRMQQMPFTLTSDQSNAIRDIARDMADPTRTASRCIAGDVGVGKTAVAGVVCAATADVPGRRAMILFPSTLVARKSYEDFRKWYPDLRITLVTGETGGTEDLEAPILMGTSALLHRKVGQVDLLILDEQHRWSREQREFHRGKATHFVEMSATCIPRTQALVRFGHIAVSEMRETHQIKLIETELLVGPEGARKLSDEMHYIIRGGSPVFVIYPKREASEDTEDRLNIESAAKRWEAMFPGKVATLTGMDDETVKEQALNDIRERRKQILLCTTVVEVGVDVANLRHIVVMEPQKYGLVQLHQLRGRVARQGGDGWCFLLAPNGLPPASRERLQAFLETTDGFKIAEADLIQRGAGDLSAKSTRQHGADGNFLHGVKINLDIYDQIIPLLEYLKAA